MNVEAFTWPSALAADDVKRRRVFTSIALSILTLAPPAPADKAASIPPNAHTDSLMVGRMTQEKKVFEEEETHGYSGKPWEQM